MKRIASVWLLCLFPLLLYAQESDITAEIALFDCACKTPVEGPMRRFIIQWQLSLPPTNRNACNTAEAYVYNLNRVLHQADSLRVHGAMC